MTAIIRAMTAFIGGGVMAGILGCGIYFIGFYWVSSIDYRDMVLVSTASTSFILGGLVAAMSSFFSYRSRIGLFAALALGFCALLVLCRTSRATIEEAGMILAIGFCALVPAALFGWWLNKKYPSR